MILEEDRTLDDIPSSQILLEASGNLAIPYYREPQSMYNRKSLFAIIVPNLGIQVSPPDSPKKGLGFSIYGLGLRTLNPKP